MLYRKFLLRKVEQCFPIYERQFVSHKDFLRIDINCLFNIYLFYYNYIIVFYHILDVSRLFFYVWKNYYIHIMGSCYTIQLS